MPEKGTNVLKQANKRISTLVWKLHKEIESAKEKDISFTDVDTVRKLAADSFKLFFEHGVLGENAHPKHRSPRPLSASPDRRQNVRTTPGSGGSASRRSKSATRIKDAQPTSFCDQVKVALNFEDDETHDCNEGNPRKLREFEERYKEANLDNIRLEHELDRVKKCIEDLEYQNRYLTYQLELAEKEKSEIARKDEKKYKRLESEVNRYKAEINDFVYRDSKNNHRVHANRYKSERDLARCEIQELKIELEKRKDNSLQTDLEYLKKILRRADVDLKSVKDENTALRHANENKTKMIEEIQNRAEEEIKDANDAIVYYKEEEQRYKKAKDDNNAQIVKLRTEKEEANGRLAKLTNERDDANRRLAKLTNEREEANGRLAKLTNERDDANRRLAKLKTERDQSNSDAAMLKVEKDELLNLLQKQKSSQNAGQHCEDALNKQLHEKDMECKQSKKLVENLNRKLDKIQSQRKEFLKPRDREDLKREENYNWKLIEENEELRNTVCEMEQQLAGQNREHIDTEHQYRSDIDRYRQERNRACSKLNTLQEQMKNKTVKLKEQEASYYEDRKQLENRIQDLEDQISDRLGKLSQQEQLDPAREELSIIKIKLSSLEDELRINKDRKYVLENENEELSNKYQDVLKKLRESESRYSSQSDIEKENESLKHELTMSLMNIEKIKQDYKDLEKKHDTEMTRYKETTYRLQNDLDSLKSQENLQKQTSRGELESLKEQRAKLETDKQILRKKIYLLENDKIGLEERMKQAELILSNQQTLREENSDLKESLETMKKEMENMEEKYKKETVIRISTDGTTTKLKDENDRLRKERNKAKYDVDKISREKEELAHELQHEIDAAKEEHDNLKKAKNELTSIFQQKAKRDQDKIDHLEKERETLVARNTSGEKATQYNAYELLQLKNDYAVCTKQKALLEEDLLDQKQDITELEKRIKDLESKDQRCTKCDQYERALAKLKKENQELQDRDLESKNQRCKKCDQYERTLAKLKKENQELQDRYNIVTTELHNAEKKILDLAEENKEQKMQNRDVTGIVKKLVQEKGELENQLRSQETSAETKVSGEVISLQRRINILQSDNADLTQKCKHKDGLQEKSDKDLRQLKTVISNLKSDIVECKQTSDTMSNRLEVLREEKLELEERMRRRSPQIVSDARNCQNCWKYRNEISELKKDINHLRDRLSEAAGNKLRENNPNIADLSDMNRPTLLADKFSSLYTDEYTDAMEVIEKSMGEAGAVHVMLEWLKSCYNWCEQLAREQRDLLTTESIGFMNKYYGQKLDHVVSDNCLIYVKEFQKKIAVDTLTAVRKICHVNSVTQENLIQNSCIVKYIHRCSELCWRMQITDPPLCLKFDVKNGENLDKTIYSAFTKNGSRIEYLVWPILLLHKSGPLLAKGVAQGT